MDYRIIVDSCGELTEEMKESGIYETAPLNCTTAVQSGYMQ